MRTTSMLALALSIGITPLSAQSAYRSSNELRPLASEARTAADIALDLYSGTLGFGLRISKLVTPHVGIRAGASYFSFSKTITQTDVEFDASLKQGSFSGLVDFFPGSRGVFHLTGGVLSNQTKIDATGTCANNSIDLNNHSYTCAEVGTLTGSVKFPSASPYLGFGVGTPAKGSRVHFVFDLGGAFGKPDLTLNASNSTSNAQLAADVQAQHDKTQKDLDKYLKIFPVIESGVGIRF